MNNQSSMLTLLERSYDERRSPDIYLENNQLSQLVYSQSVSIRTWLAKALAYHHSKDYAVPLLSKLSKDKESCVRLEAVDSLSDFICQESFDALIRSINDKEELIRAYASFGVAFVGRYIDPQKAFQILLHMANDEPCNRVLVGVHEGLYLLGKTESIHTLLDLFYNPDYHVQCAVIHAIMEIVNSDNHDFIKDFITGLNVSEYVYAVKDAIQQLNKLINK